MTYQINVVPTWSAVLESNRCSALHENFLLPPSESLSKSVTLRPAGKLQTERCVFNGGRTPFRLILHQSAHFTRHVQIPSSVTLWKRGMLPSFRPFASRCRTASPWLGDKNGGLKGTHGGITQPPAIRGPVTAPKSPTCNEGIESEKSGARPLLCTAVWAELSATGVRNKVRFLHGHHKFPSASN